MNPSTSPQWENQLVAAIKPRFPGDNGLSREAYPESLVLDNPEAIAGLMRDHLRTQSRVSCVVGIRRLIGMQNNILRNVSILFWSIHVRSSGGDLRSEPQPSSLVHQSTSGDPTPSEADIKKSPAT